MKDALALDTSVAVPLLLRDHTAHGVVVRWWSGRTVSLCGHAVVETYAVLTRLPGNLRVRPTDAARLIAERFAAPLLLGPATSTRLPDLLSELDIAGGAVYDALIGLTALEHGTPLATRDARAHSTYEAVGAQVVVAA